MRVDSFIYAILMASLAETALAQICCKDCNILFNNCEKKCVAQGKSRTVCAKICYGTAVSYSFVCLESMGLRRLQGETRLAV